MPPRLASDMGSGSSQRKRAGRSGCQCTHVLPERAFEPATTQRTKQSGTVVYAQRRHAPPGEVISVSLKALQNGIAQALAFPGEFGVEGFIVVDPGGQNRTKGVQINNEIESPAYIV